MMGSKQVDRSSKIKPDNRPQPPHPSLRASNSGVVKRTQNIASSSSSGSSQSSVQHYLPTASSTSLVCLKDRLAYYETCQFQYCENADKYEKVAKIGQGTFGEVFKAKERRNPKKLVAMKKVLMENEKEGFPITAIREIKILQQLKHDNVVNLLEICRSKGNRGNRFKSTFFLIFEFCEHDLAGLLSNMHVKFCLGEIKKVMQQMFNGLHYIHSNKILHRDMKAANVLITKNGILKLADFGLARAFSLNTKPEIRYTNKVVTLWYRAPELLLGDHNYGTPVDLWGAGCIMAEMWTRSPIMQGNTEQQQLVLISHLCGSITPQVWPDVTKLHLFGKMELPANQRRKVKDRLRPYMKDPDACDLLDKLLTLDPTHRINADNALEHNFFWNDPLPTDLSKMLAQHTQSMFEYLAPPRRTIPLQIGHHPGRAHVSHTSTSKISSVETGYHDRIF